MNREPSEFPANFSPQFLSDWVLARAHPGWLGLKYHDHGENWVEMELPWREDLIGDPDFPVLASGPIISLLDMASGMCIWATNGRFRPVATLDLRVDYQRPARDHASVIGYAECYKVTRSAAFVRGWAHDGDPEDPVAHMAGVFLTIPFERETMFAKG